MSDLTSALGSWSGWLRPGHFISYLTEGGRIYEHIIRRDLGHWEYDWEETIASLTVSGPFIPADLEITKGYDSNTKQNRIWQMIFGIKTQTYIYIELPTDLHRHGIPKDPKPSAANRLTSHFTEWMSPFMEPSFITEHFLMKDEGLNQIAFDAYNPTSITLTPRLNIFLAKMSTERVGTEMYEDGKLVLAATQARFNETLDKLYRRVIPHRPLTLMPVRAPAAA